MSDWDELGMTETEWDSYHAELHEHFEELRWSAVEQLAAAAFSPVNHEEFGVNWPGSCSIERDGIWTFIRENVAARLLCLKAAICLGMNWRGQGRDLPWFNTHQIDLDPPGRDWGKAWLYTQCFGGIRHWHADVSVEEPDTGY